MNGHDVVHAEYRTVSPRLREGGSAPEKAASVSKSWIIMREVPDLHRIWRGKAK